jgi:periplasmic protein CpxP/Spy
MKKLAYALLALALFAPAALFAQAGGPGAPGGAPGGGRRMLSVADQLDDLSKKLDLTDAQKPQVKAVLEDQDKKMRDLMENSSGPREENRAKMREIHESSNAKIRALLTAEQKTKFDKMQEEHRKQMEERRRGGDEGVPPPPPPNEQ